MAGRFPAPYMNETNVEDPIMERVPVAGADMGIGQGKVSRPKGLSSENGMNIKHIGGALGKGE